MPAQTAYNAALQKMLATERTVSSKWAAKRMCDSRVPYRYGPCDSSPLGLSPLDAPPTAGREDDEALAAARAAEAKREARLRVAQATQAVQLESTLRKMRDASNDYRSRCSSPV